MTTNKVKTAPRMMAPADPNRKVAVIQINTLFGECKESDFNSVNTSLTEAIKRNGTDIVLMYDLHQDKEKAERAMRRVGADAVVQNPLNAGEGCFADIARDFGVAQHNLLFVASGSLTTEAINGEGLMLCETVADMEPNAFINDYQGGREQKTRASMTAIRKALTQHKMY